MGVADLAECQINALQNLITFIYILSANTPWEIVGGNE